MIELADVHFSYQSGVEALRGVDLKFESGCICLLGHNGAGKTTLFRHLNGLLKPSQGVVKVSGVDTRDRRPAHLAKHVGLAFQNPDAQLFKDTIIDEVRFGAENGRQETASAEELTQWAVESLGLRQVVDLNPYDVLLGTRKRIAVASVVAMDTPAVALDEPTGGQDAKGVRLLGDLVEQLLSKDKLVIIATHDIEFARDYADRIVVLAEGLITQNGTPAEVFGARDDLKAAGVEPPFVTQLAAELNADQTMVEKSELIGWIRNRMDT